MMKTAVGKILALTMDLRRLQVCFIGRIIK